MGAFVWRLRNYIYSLGSLLVSFSRGMMEWGKGGGDGRGERTKSEKNPQKCLLLSPCSFSHVCFTDWTFDSEFSREIKILTLR